MLDLKMIRENPRDVIARLALRNKDFTPEIENVLALDTARRESLNRAESLKAEQNAASKKIPELKKSGADTTELMARMKDISQQVGALETALRDIEDKLNTALLTIPNMPREGTPPGVDSESNAEVRRWGTPPTFDFEPKAHWDIGEALGILDPGTAAKTTGARFHFYKGLGARLERAITNFYLDVHTKKGYTEIFPPFMVNRASMTGTGQLPKFEEDAFKLSNADYFLVPTAEVPVTNMHREEILQTEALPLRYCAYSACFRAEAGSAGRDTRGLIRQHQFNKVELVKFTEPDKSYEELETLTADAEEVLKLLGLPYRVVRLCGGDLGFCSAQTYDIEVWMPSYNRYVEISSCSNFEDYQARRAGIRFREGANKPQFVHTLNGSGVAVGRTTATILEVFQQKDGSVVIPDVLRPYMGVDRIEAAGHR